MSYDFKSNGIILGLCVSTPTALQAKHKCDEIHDLTHEIAPNDSAHIKKSNSIVI